MVLEIQTILCVETTLEILHLSVGLMLFKSNFVTEIYGLKGVILLTGSFFTDLFYFLTRVRRSADLFCLCWPTLSYHYFEHVVKRLKY